MLQPGQIYQSNLSDRILKILAVNYDQNIFELTIAYNSTSDYPPTHLESINSFEKLIEQGMWSLKINVARRQLPDWM